MGPRLCSLDYFATKSNVLMIKLIWTPRGSLPNKTASPQILDRELEIQSPRAVTLYL